MTKYLLIILLLLTTGCSTTVIRNPLKNETNEIGSREFQNAVKKNDSDTVQLLLKDKSFIEKTYFPMGEIDINLKKFQAYQMIDFVLKGEGDAFTHIEYGVCRTKIVQTLLDANLPPRTKDLSNAAQIPCPDIVEIILNKLSNDDVQNGTKIFLEFFNEKIKSGNEHYRDPKNTEQFMKVLQVLKQKSVPSIKTKIAEAEKLINQYMNRPIQNSQIGKIRIGAVENEILKKNKKERCKLYDFFAENCISHIPPLGFRFIQILSDGILAQWPGSESMLYIKMNRDLIKTTESFRGETLIVSDLYIEHEGKTEYRNLRGQKMIAEVFKSYEN